MFGGWANRWFGDAVSIDVSSAVGPPYAVSSMEPPLGPVTGGTPAIIRGQGFPNRKGQGLNARFFSQDGKKFVDAPAKVIDSESLEVETPSMQEIGPGISEVRVQVRGNALTITAAPFNFFDVTSCEKSLCFGSGLVPGVVVATSTGFFIQSRDASNLNRTTGGDEYEVRILAGHGAARRVLSEEEDGCTVSIEDLGTGMHRVEYYIKRLPRESIVAADRERTKKGGNPKAVPSVEIEVEFKGTFGGVPGLVRGCPIVVPLVDPVKQSDREQAEEEELIEARSDWTNAAQAEQSSQLKVKQAEAEKKKKIAAEEAAEAARSAWAAHGGLPPAAAVDAAADAAAAPGSGAGEDGEKDGDGDGAGGDGAGAGVGGASESKSGDGDEAGDDSGNKKGASASAGSGSHSESPVVPQTEEEYA